MEEIIEIRWSSGSIDLARKVSRQLVNEKIVASAKIIPWIESIYLLDNKLETNQESLVIFTSRKMSFGKVKDVIMENSRYDVEELSCVSIVEGSSKYLDWVRESTLAP